jgi:hypothetical protein
MMAGVPRICSNRKTRRVDPTCHTRRRALDVQHVQFDTTLSELLLDVLRTLPDVHRVARYVRDAKEVSVVAQDLRFVRLPMAPRYIHR